MIGTAIQQKYVYLFELDSVRDSDEEIIAGQAAIYDEIVRKGNTVVLTYNQLVDSRAFFSLMTDEAYYRNILQLFEQGCIRISQFGDIRTVAQYILSTVDANKRFIYSALPLKFTQKRLIALVQRSLVYSDLSEIREYMEGGRRSDEDVEDLFIELERDDAGNVKRISMDGDGEDVAMHRDILKNLYSFLSIILRLSMLHDVYIAPRKASEIAPFRFHHVLQCVLRLSMSSIPQWEEVRAILQDLPAFRAGQNGRSRYHRDLYRQFHDGGLADAQRQAYSLAEAVVDLCYNYVCEISICNISKHYNVEELRELDSPKPTFAADFMRRLQIVWDRGNQVKSRFLREMSWPRIVLYLCPCPRHWAACTLCFGMPGIRSACRELYRQHRRGPRYLRRAARRLRLISSHRRNCAIIRPTGSAMAVCLLHRMRFPLRIRATEPLSASWSAPWNSTIRSLAWSTRAATIPSSSIPSRKPMARIIPLSASC